MASEQTMASIASSLELIAKVSVLQLIDSKERNEQLVTLESLGYKHTEIATMLGMKSNTVSVTLKRLKQAAE